VWPLNQGQPSQSSLFTTQGRHGAAHFGGARGHRGHRAHRRKRRISHQGEKRVPMAHWSDGAAGRWRSRSPIQLLHCAPCFLSWRRSPKRGGVAARVPSPVPPPVAWLAHLNQPGRTGGDHVVAAGHQPTAGQAATGLSAVAQLTGMARSGARSLAHLQATQPRHAGSHAWQGNQDPRRSRR